jgi:hypothetical protein
MIPLGNSILYVEPVFLQAEGGGLPELKRVILATADKIAMKPSIAESLAAIFGESLPVTGEPETELPEIPSVETPFSSDIVVLIEQAQQHYEQAQEFVKNGDWAGFGEEWAKLENVLEELARLTAIEP